MPMHFQWRLRLFWPKTPPTGRKLQLQAKGIGCGQPFGQTIEAFLAAGSCFAFCFSFFSVALKFNAQAAGQPGSPLRPSRAPYLPHLEARGVRSTSRAFCLRLQLASHLDQPQIQLHWLHFSAFAGQPKTKSGQNYTHNL